MPNIPACNPRPSWNDQISSLRTVGRNSFTLLFEDRNYGGAAACVDPNVVVRDLARFGWDDITS